MIFLWSPFSWIDSTNKYLKYRADTTSGTGGDDVYYDLGTTLSDTDWVMRFTWTWDNPSDDTKWFFGISDQAGKNGGVDGIRGDGTADSAGTLWYCGGGGCTGTYSFSPMRSVDGSAGASLSLIHI